jgi:hypothetical protein
MLSKYPLWLSTTSPVIHKDTRGFFLKTVCNIFRLRMRGSSQVIDRFRELTVIAESESVGIDVDFNVGWYTQTLNAVSTWAEPAENWQVKPVTASYTADCLERLHTHNVKLYWTETGNGGAPESGLDAIGGNIIVQVAPNASSFSVTYAGTHTDTYPISSTAGPTGGNSTTGAASTTPKYAWSKKSGVYHLTSCRFVQNISPDNLERGDTPPAGKTLHKNCPE